MSVARVAEIQFEDCENPFVELEFDSVKVLGSFIEVNASKINQVILKDQNGEDLPNMGVTTAAEYCWIWGDENIHQSEVCGINKHG